MNREHLMNGASPAAADRKFRGMSRRFWTCLLTIVMVAGVALPTVTLADSSNGGYSVIFKVGEIAVKTVALPASENGEPVFIPPDALPTEEEIAAANPDGRVLGWIVVQDDSDESGDTLDSRIRGNDSGLDDGDTLDSRIRGNDSGGADSGLDDGDTLDSRDASRSGMTDEDSNTDEPSPCVEYTADAELIASGAYLDIAEFAVTGDVVFLATGVPSDSSEDEDGTGFPVAGASAGPGNDNGLLGDGSGFLGNDSGLLGDTLDSRDASRSGMTALGGGISPLGAGDDITEITVSVSPASFQTYTNLDINTAPPELTVGITPMIAESYVDGGTIELPLDFTPTAATHPYFTYGTDGTDGVGSGLEKSFFILNESSIDTTSPSSIIKSYTVDTDGSVPTLVLTLKSKAEYAADNAGLPIAGAKLETVRFDFNSDYKMKIPVGTTLWSAQPKAYVNAALAAAAAPAVVKGSASHEIDYATSYFIPTNQYYNGGAISVRLGTRNLYYYESDFDPAYTNIVYVEVPTGSVLSQALRDYYKDGMTTIGGYDRYYRKVENKSSSWGSWGYSGLPYYVFTQFYPGQFTPPVMANDTTFQVRIGADYRKMNGEIKQSSASVSYTKKDRNIWELYTASYHSAGDTNIAAAVCNITNGSVTQTENGTKGTVYASFSNYTYEAATKNTGSGPITGVSFELYYSAAHHASANTSARINFDNIYIVATRDAADAPDYPDWSQYKVKYEITDTNGTAVLTDDSVRKEDGQNLAPTSATASQTFTLTKPTINGTEYISKVTLIPMDTDGNTAGVLPSRNGLCIAYNAKAWPDRKWPDGTSVPIYTAVPMVWTMFYNDNPDKPGAYPGDYATNSAYDTYKNKSFGGGTGYTYYSGAPYARAQMISENASGRKPGDVVSYEIHGMNAAAWTVVGWEKPRVAVRVPKALELVGISSVSGTETLTLTDVASSNTYDVLAKWESSDASYNYYSFQALNYTAPERTGGTAVFRIPVQFRVSAAAFPGTYPIGRVLVSSQDAAGFAETNLALNNLPSGDGAGAAAKYGFSAGDNYHYSSLASTSVEVLSVTDISVATSIKSIATDNTFVAARVVPATPGEEVEVKLTITNSGNAAVNNIKLYDILPKAGDLLDSTGTIAFSGISQPAGATIRYATAGASKPPYGKHGQTTSDAAGAGDLQISAFQTGANWSTAAPVPISNTTAVFIDFGASKEILPGESIEVIMKFTIPASVGQTAFNQFRYSAKEVDQEAKVNLDSPIAGFSTEAIMIDYQGNIPSTTYNLDDLANMPANSSAIFRIDGEGSGKDSLSVSSLIPTLTGYTFKGWSTDEDDGDLDSGVASGLYTFTKAPDMLRLYAQWSRNVITVDYDEQGGDNFTPAFGSTSAFYGGTVGGSADGTTVPYVAPGTPTRSGYDFVGWYESASLASAQVSGTEWDFTSDTVTDPSTNGATKTLYAGWKAKYTVTYYGTGSTGGSAPTDTAGNAPSGNTYYTGSEVTVLGPGSLVKTNYTFAGWDTSSAADTVVYTAAAITAGTAKFTITANTNLYPVWTENAKYTVTYHDTNATGGSAPTDTAGNAPSGNTYYTGSQVTVLGKGSLVKTNYTFAGWDTSSDADTAVYSAAAITAGTAKFTITANTNLYPVWTENAKYTVSYAYGLHGSGTMPNVSVYTGDSHIALDSGFTPDMGYYFTGWVASDGKAGAVAVSEEITNITGNVTLTAQWQINRYTVTYFGNGNTSGTAPSSAAYDYNTMVSVKDNGSLARTGYTFLGWAQGANGAVQYTAGSVFAITGDTNLYAVWSHDSYTVRYLPGAHGTFAAQVTNGLHYGNTTPAGPQTTSGEEGWHFTGWSPLRMLVVTDSADYTAQWEINLYTVYYHGNGHTAGTEPEAVTLSHGSAWTAAAQGSLARDGFTFLGWSADSEAAAAALSPGDVNTLTGDVHLYAVWQAVPPPAVDPRPPVVVNPPVTPPGGDDDNPGDDEDDDDIVAPPAGGTTQTPPTEEPDAPTDTSVVQNEITVNGTTLRDFGFNESDVSKLEAQTGNLFNDIGSGNVPLGNFLGKGAWSLVSLILSFIGVVVSACLIAGAALARRRKDEEVFNTEEDQYRRKGGFLRALAVIAGILTAVIFLILDDLSAPVVWVNQYTIIVGIVFIVHILFAVIYKARKGNEPDETAGTAPQTTK